MKLLCSAMFALYCFAKCKALNLVLTWALMFLPEKLSAVKKRKKAVICLQMLWSDENIKNLGEWRRFKEFFFLGLTSLYKWARQELCFWHPNLNLEGFYSDIITVWRHWMAAIAYDILYNITQYVFNEFKLALSYNYLIKS